ncbi:MAG: urea ABC transporter permease subunit UrtB [Ancalomicrobiaceae bacterium]|nr:urea ABC transporter permease subunit UrtB [Ancalomicrobiaceae bacterium]
MLKSIAAAIRRLSLTIVAIVAVTIVQPVLAADIDGTIQLLTTDGYSDTIEAIGQLSTSGHPRALAIVQALSDGKLQFSDSAKKVYIDTGAGLVDAATGDAVATPPADVSDVRQNNRVRGVVQAALGALSLFNPDPQKRREAAEAVFKSRDENALPAIDASLAKETVPEVATALKIARAAIVLFKSDAAEADRVVAAQAIQVAGTQDAVALLRSLPADAPKTVVNTAQASAKTIENNLALWSTAQNAWYGLSLGSVLLLAAIGLAITFGVMGIINMAHGEMVMLGAYVTFMVQEVIRNHFPSLFDLSLPIAIPLAFIVSGLVGVAIERTVIRWLYGRPLDTLLATWGISLALQQLVRTTFGANNREVGSPSWMSGSFQLGQLSITWGRMWIIVFALVVFAGLILILKKTPLGLQMRAVTQNRSMASAMGIPTPWIDALTFGLGCGIAGIAGVALSQIDNVSPNLGQGYIIDSFMVVVFGGVGNLWGTLVGAMTLGIVNKFLEPVAGAVLGKILVLVAIILFIQKRPRGLFALKGRAVEA